MGNRVPASLKVFVVAFAVIDDLCAIIIIAVFYTADVSFLYLAGALTVWGSLIACNRFFKVKSLIPDLLGGLLMWFLMLKSGVHATIAGVLLAFAIPLSAKEDDEESPSHKLEHLLHKPVSFVILPIFALANTAIVIGADWAQSLTTANDMGIIGGSVTWQTPWRNSFKFCSGIDRPLPPSSRSKLALRLRHRIARWHWLHDVYLHHKPRVRRQLLNRQCLKDGGPPSFSNSRNHRLPLAQNSSAVRKPSMKIWTMDFPADEM